MDKNNMKEIFSNKDFIKELLSLEDTAAVMAALKAKGLDLSEEEVLAVRDLLAKIKSGEITAEDLKQMESGQIPDSMLDLVSGGSIVAGVILGLGIAITVKDAVDLATREDNLSGSVAYGGASGSWNENSDIIIHGSGASGSWNENSDIIIHGGGVSGGW